MNPTCYGAFFSDRFRKEDQFFLHLKGTCPARMANAPFYVAAVEDESVTGWQSSDGFLLYYF